MKPREPFNRAEAEAGRGVMFDDGTPLSFVAADDTGTVICRMVDGTLIRPVVSHLRMANDGERGMMPEALFQAVIKPLGDQLQAAREARCEEIMISGAFARDVRLVTTGVKTHIVEHPDGGATYYAEEELYLE